MPELRLVVLATQDRIAFAPTFAEALSSLFGNNTGAKPPQASAGGAPPNPPPQQSGPVQQGAAPTESELIDRAASDLADYQKLTAEGKLGEAGQKLESLKGTLEQLQKARQQTAPRAAPSP